MPKRFCNFFSLFSGNSFTRNFNVIAKEFCLLLRAFAVEGAEESSYHCIDLLPSGTHFPAFVGGENEGQITVRCKSQVSIHVTSDSWRMNERIADSSSMSHGFCHISIDVESSTHSHRSTLAVTHLSYSLGFESLYFRWRGAFRRTYTRTDLVYVAEEALCEQVSVPIDGINSLGRDVIEENEGKRLHLKKKNVFERYRSTTLAQLDSYLYCNLVGLFCKSVHKRYYLVLPI